MRSTTTTPGTLAYAEETNRMAQANHRLALTNWDNTLPWRYLKWRRVHREVKRGEQIVRDRFNAHAAAMGWGDRL